MRNIIIGVATTSLEEASRKYSSALDKDNKTKDDKKKEIEKKNEKKSRAKKCLISFDGKTLRGSFDNFKDQKAIQLLIAFSVDSKIILAHQEVEEKTNEIPVAQELMQELGLTNCIFTFDAINCQKKL